MFLSHIELRETRAHMHRFGLGLELGLGFRIRIKIGVPHEYSKNFIVDF